MFLVTLCEELKNNDKSEQTRVQAGIYLKNSLDAKVGCDVTVMRGGVTQLSASLSHIHIFLLARCDDPVPQRPQDQQQKMEMTQNWLALEPEKKQQIKGGVRGGASSSSVVVLPAHPRLPILVLLRPRSTSTLSFRFWLLS